MTGTFGQFIRSLRDERGLTQRALSQAVGFRSLAHLSDIESGKRNPAKETLPKFAKALGVSLEELESRDTRGPIEAAKALFAKRPEMVGAFLKVIEVAKKMDAGELVARVSAAKVQPEPASDPSAVLEKPVVKQQQAPSLNWEPALEVAKPVPAKKPSDQPTLF